MTPDETPRDRTTAIPNANSPQLLTQLLEMVARGVRSTRGLQEALGVDVRTVRYYLQAGVWLGFLRDEPEPVLTAEGMGYVYGGQARPRLYAEAVDRQPFVADLVRRHGRTLPDPATLAAAIAARGLAPATAERRGSSVRGLLGPWLDARAAAHLADGQEQLSLPFAQVARLAPEPPLAKLAGRSFSPDIYRHLLAHLIDHGELTLGHVRGLLDRAGADDVPLGAYVDLALERGDATRIDERLVVSAAAVRRREIAATTTGVILSDGGWRSHLDTQRADPNTPVGRYRLWDHRLWGRPPTATTLEADLATVLRDRSLASFPRTDGDPGPAPRIVHAPYLECWQEPGLIVALPPSLLQLWEGVGAVNRRLRNARHRADAVGVPTPAYAPVAVHGGVLHPGATAPRSVPDGRSLRQRLVSHSPYVTLTVALLLLHRAASPAWEVVRSAEGWWVRRHRRRIAPLLEALDAFVVGQGGHPSRQPVDGLDAGTFIGLLERSALVVVAGDRLLLDDVWFHQLRTDDEEAPVAAALEPLSVALGDHLERIAAGPRA